MLLLLQPHDMWRHSVGAEVVLVEWLLRHVIGEGHVRSDRERRTVRLRLRRVLLELPLDRLHDAAEVGVDGVIDEAGRPDHVPAPPRLQPRVRQARGHDAQDGPRRLRKSGSEKDSESEPLPARHEVGVVLHVGLHFGDVVVEDPERVDLLPAGEGHAAALARQGAPRGGAAAGNTREVEIHACALCFPWVPSHSRGIHDACLLEPVLFSRKPLENLFLPCWFNCLR